MSHRLEIKLLPSVVVPLVELIRALRREIDPDESSRDLSTVVDLFPPDLASAGKIHIGPDEQRPILIGCTIFRFHIRRTLLAAIPDEVVEAGLDTEHSGDASRTVVTCYFFLATLQTVILESKRPRAPVPAMLARGIQTLGGRVRHMLRPRLNPPVSSGTSDACHVVVLNDPVNLMAYVTFVFQTELAMDTEMAARRMREVHEHKRSVVWTGPRKDAEHVVLRLRQWHLTARAEPMSDPTSRTAS